MEDANTLQIFSWDSLPEILKLVLPQHNTYLIKEFIELPPYRTAKNFDITQFELKAYVNADSKEEAHKWFAAFQSRSKTTMAQTRGFTITGNWILYREIYHCIHSNEVKKKQGIRKTKRPQSARAHNIGCNATIHLRLERKRLSDNHSLEIELKFAHNHIINSAESLSFRRVKEEVREEFINLFRDGHSPSSALYAYEDSIHLNASDEQELLEILADRAKNPNYDYVAKLFQKYRESALGSHNGKPMFEHLKEIVEEYNGSGQGRAILQEYNANSGNAFILYIVTNLMARVNEKVHQAGKICYMNASAAFDPLNTLITLLYTSCTVGALPLGVFFTSDELEITLEKAVASSQHFINLILSNLLNFTAFITTFILFYS
ncbi:hypothetical protein RclHR1_04230007 [Rhizophagus clarus]|uniref:MULE transposase domain-containing protein n=1 Tax=Rhizophagus clarus TaxID=94130 RepID=A0A2Z6RYK1_9GLOM|nr:hypothetical protein RclHR1_04230007 [Rhizophagus clarus]